MASSGDSSNGSVKREGTMQRTVREAKEYSYGCNCGEVEGEHDHDQETGQPVVKPTRQSTMEKTAQEGIQFLKDQHKNTLLEVQGLVPAREKASADVGSDDEATDEDEDTTELTGGLEDDDEEEPLTGENGDDSNASSGALKVAKQRTMLATAKEGQDLLDNYMGGNPSGRTRGQQRAHEQDESGDDDEGDDDGPDSKRPRRTHTMLETTQDAQRMVSDPHSMGGTRSETAAVKQAAQEGHKRKQ